MAGRQIPTAWGLSLGHLSALRVPRRGFHFISSPYPGLREPVGSLAPRYSLSPRNGAFGFGGRTRPQGFKSGGRQIIAGGAAASAA